MRIKKKEEIEVKVGEGLAMERRKIEEHCGDK